MASGATVPRREADRAVIVRRFLLWVRTAPPADRAEAVGALAKAYLHSPLSASDRWEAETALTAMLDDRSVVVRRAMAEVFAGAPDAPRHIVIALAGDQYEVAAPILAGSPVLLDCDLVDCAALGDARVQAVVAGRARVSVAVSAALVEIGTADALERLARNPGAEIAEAGLFRIVERYGDRSALREALLSRPDLPAEVSQAIAAALATTLEAMAKQCNWLSPERSGRLIREARERTTVALSARSRSEVARFVAYLRRSGQLTPALILRAILSREVAFATASFADLAQVSVKRATAILSDRRGGGFRALYAKAELPEGLRPAFEAAVGALRNESETDALPQLSRRMIEQVLTACQRLPEGEAGRLVGLLRRFEMEAARDEARRIAGGLADDAALRLVMQHAPDELAAPAGAIAA